MKRLFGVITLLLFVHILFSQPPVTEQQARAELNKLGIDEDLMRQKLLERGIDIDNVDQSDPGRLIEVQKAIEEVIAEIEAEKAGTTAPPVNPDPQPIPDQVIVDSTQNAIEDIKAVDYEQNVAEKLIDEYQETLPPSLVYGQHVFRNKSIQLYRQSEDIKPPDSYVLGVGDIIAISIWGASQEGGVYEINKSGFITPSQMPRIYLKGISYGKAKDLLSNRFSNYYRFRPEEFEVTINYSRTITINIVGEAINYGSFTIPAINTAFNALVAAGGPSDIGSVRNIQLIRAGEQPKQIDIYEYLLDPSIQNEYYLQENDYIHIPIADRLVSISGAVKKGYTFELVKGEELKTLIEFAGGFKDNAYKGNIQIKRFVNDKEEIIDVDYRDLEQSGKDFQLLSGDIVQVKTIAKPYKNFIEIAGAVEFPGRFELTNDMKVSELIEKAILNEEARTDVAFIQRSNTDGTVRYERIDLQSAITNPNTVANLALKPKDKLIIYAQERFVDDAVFSVVGEVRNPIKIPFSVGKEIRIEDAILLAGGLQSDATPFAYLRRLDPNNEKKVNFIRIDIQKALTDPSSADNIVLSPNDELRVYSTSTFTDDATVNVSGAVRKPGAFQYAENFSLKDILTMAGGLKLEAAKSRVEVFRVVFNNDQPTETIIATLTVDDDLNVVSNGGDFDLAPFDLVIVRKVPEFELQNVVTINGEVKYPGPYPLMNDNERLLSIVERAGGMTKEAFTEGITLYRQEEDIGFIVVELDNILKDKTASSNFILKAGDVIEIPKQKGLVTILGATKINELYPEKIVAGGKINVAFHKHKNAKWYVDHYAAGVADNGQRKNITVEHPNG
ncbi:MAG: protein involved in polysaccharide export with SLBB domain, partial [Saprospiraceae bacterium]